MLIAYNNLYARNRSFFVYFLKFVILTSRECSKGTGLPFYISLMVPLAPVNQF